MASGSGSRTYPSSTSSSPVSGGRALFGRYHLHMDPAEAARVAEGLGTKVAIPCHYHFELRGVPRFVAKELDVAHRKDEFVRQAVTLCPSVEVVVLDVGASWTRPSRNAR